MKTNLKLLSLLLALLMAVSCFAACKGDEKGESSGDESDVSVAQDAALAEYEKLESNTDKLLYFPSTKHPAAGSVATIIGGDADMPSGETPEKLAAGLDASVDKLSVQGQDLLQQLGGELGLNGELLITPDGANYDLAAALAGAKIDLDVAADKDGVSVTSPFLLTQPVYVPYGFIENLATPAASATARGSLNLQAMVSLNREIVAAVEKWYEEKLTEENCKHIAELFKGLVPEEAITVSTVTPAELKGAYITSDIETECVSLVVTEELARQAVKDFNDKVLTDEVFKDIAVSLIQCFSEQLSESLGVGSAEEVYSGLADSLAELVGSFDESADDSAGDTVTINRYFAGGRPVKTDVTIKDGESESLNLAIWDAYSDFNARQYGLKLSLDGREYLSVIGGANENAADMEIKANITLESVSVGPDGANSTVYDVGSVDITASRGEGGVSFKGSLKLEDGGIDAIFERGIDATFEVLENNGVVTASAQVKLEGGVTASMNYTGSEASGSFSLSVADDAASDGLEIKADRVTADGKTNVNADVAVLIEGEKLAFNVKCETVVTEGDDKTEADVKLEVVSEGLIELGVSVKLTVDTNPAKTPEAPTKDGAYVIESEEDIQGILNIINPSIAQMLEGSNDVTTDM